MSEKVTKYRLTESQQKLILNEVSQSKKVRKYVSFSSILKWYNENKNKIASYLGINVDLLPKEGDLLKYTDELIKDIINPQETGRTSIIDKERNIAFKAFNRIEGRLIHDILHVLYNIDVKEFEKELGEYEFTESELIEEIEVLAIEETFMKYMNVEHVKSDFVNQNINQLVSYLMVTILKNDPDRIVDIILGDEEPYLEVYGKKYPTKGTAYEGLFGDLLVNAPNYISGPRFKIDNDESLRRFLGRILTHGLFIDEAGGDRAFYGRDNIEAWTGGAVEDDYDWDNVTETIESYGVTDYELEDGYQIDQLMDMIIENETARALLRRAFRTASVVRNNTAMGKRGRNPAFMDIEARYDFPSISKNLMTNNASRLWNLLNEFRGYVIKNFKEIRQDFKEGNKKAKEISDAINGMWTASIGMSRESGQKLLRKKIHPYFLELERLSDYVGRMDVDLSYRMIHNSHDISHVGQYVDLRTKPEDYDMLNFLTDEFEKLKNLHQILRTVDPNKMEATKNQLKNFITRRMMVKRGAGYDAKKLFDIWGETTFLDYVKSEVGIQTISEIVKSFQKNRFVVRFRTTLLTKNQMDDLLSVYNSGIENGFTPQEIIMRLGNKLIEFILKNNDLTKSYTVGGDVRVHADTDLNTPGWSQKAKDTTFMNYLSFKVLLKSKA